MIEDCETNQINFNSLEWIHDKRLELAKLIFKQCLNIDDFTNAHDCRIKYDFIQSPEFSIKLDTYKPSLQILFGSSIIRSLMNYASENKRNSVNIIKQLLKYFGYRLYSQSEYQCLLENGKKKYSTYYYIQNIQNVSVEFTKSLPMQIKLIIKLKSNTK